MISYIDLKVNEITNIAVQRFDSQQLLDNWSYKLHL